jgi:hypothetical protein
MFLAIARFLIIISNLPGPKAALRLGLPSDAYEVTEMFSLRQRSTNLRWWW